MNISWNIHEYPMNYPWISHEISMNIPVYHNSIPFPVSIPLISISPAGFPIPPVKAWTFSQPCNPSRPETCAPDVRPVFRRSKNVRFHWNDDVKKSDFHLLIGIREYSETVHLCKTYSKYRINVRFYWCLIEIPWSIWNLWNQKVRSSGIYTWFCLRMLKFEETSRLPRGAFWFSRDSHFMDCDHPQTKGWFFLRYPPANGHKLGVNRPYHHFETH